MSTLEASRRSTRVSQLPFTFYAPGWPPASSARAAETKEDDISDYASANEDADSNAEGGSPLDSDEEDAAAQAVVPSSQRGGPAAGRRRRSSASSDRVVKRVRRARTPPPSGSPSSRNRTRASAASPRTPVPSCSGLLCPAASCGHLKATAMGDHLRSVHTGANSLIEQQLASIGYCRCPKCHGSFRRHASGEGPWRHTCVGAASTPAPANSRSGPPRSVQQSSMVEEDTVETRYFRLACLPTFRGLLPVHVVREWILLCERLAAAYLADSTSEEALFQLLAAPKLALSPWRDPDLSLLKSICAYPDVPQIKGRPVSSSDRPPTAIGPQVHRLLKRQQVRRAAAALDGHSKILTMSPALLERVRSKFRAPRAPAFTSVGPAPRPSDFDDEALAVQDCLRAFPVDVGGGISGWTKPLLTLALKSETFVRFVKLLTRQLIAGTAPGRSMLTASLLTPLAKGEDDVRPIACGELIYRLCAKMVLAVVPLGGALLPCQLGMGTAGGVEPIVLQAQQVADGSAGPLTHVTSIDFVNAYGSIQRGPLDQAIRRYAAGLWRLAKYRYEQAGKMVMVSAGEVHLVDAAEGVYQGDPLAGLLFCVAVRPVLERLLEFLSARGFTARALCYLDDWTIFSDRPGALEATREFFDQASRDGIAAGLQLSLRKSWERSGEQLRAQGHEVLGTMIGGAEARRTFLLAQTSRITASLARLDALERQDALLLLRRSIQHRLRHLQRLLPTTDIEAAWGPADDALLRGLRMIRDGAADPRRGQYDSVLFQLPLRLGGLAVPRHALIAPHARASMEQPAQRLLNHIFPPPDGQASAAEEPPPTQRQLSQQVFQQLDEELHRMLSLEQAQTVLGQGSRFGRAWLDTFPTDSRTTLDDHQVRAALYTRTLLRATGPTCPDCLEVQAHGHDDDCTRRPHRRTVRHDYIKHLFVAALRRVKGTQVAVESPLESASQRRTDWRIHGAAAANGSGTTDYDLTIISMTNSTAKGRPDRAAHEQLAAAEGMRAAAKTRLSAYLDWKANVKIKNYAPAVPSAFVPFVLSLDGAEHPQATAALKHWRSIMPSFSYLVESVSVALVRTRADTFCLA